MKVFVGLECVTSTSWLAFGVDPDHDADTGILKEFLPLRDKGNSTNFTDNSSIVVDKFLRHSQQGHNCL